MFEAGEYDHIFDVELGDGIMRKLPFDNGSNPLVAADKFIIREGLHKSMCEQISKFLKDNSSPYATSDNAEKKQGLAAKKQMGGGTGTIEVPKPQGMKTHLFFDQIAIDGPKKKLLEFNDSLAILNPNELKVLDEVLETIKNKAFYHSSKFSKQEYDVVKKLLKFPADKAFPSLDIYRMFLMHPGATENYKVYETGIENLSALIGYLGDSPQPTQLMVLRCLANLFKHPASIFVLTQKRQFVVDHTAGFI